MMNKTIEFKYDIGEEVYFICECAITIGMIKDFVITGKDGFVVYQVDYFKDNIDLFTDTIQEKDLANEPDTLKEKLKTEIERSKAFGLMSVEYTHQYYLDQQVNRMEDNINFYRSKNV